MTRALPILLVLLAAPALAQEPRPGPEARSSQPPLAAAVWCPFASSGEETPGCDVGIAARLVCWRDRHCAVGLWGGKTLGIGYAYIAWRDTETGRSLAFGAGPTTLYTLEGGILTEKVYWVAGMTAGFGGGKQ